MKTIWKWTLHSAFCEWTETDRRTQTKLSFLKGAKRVKDKLQRLVRCFRARCGGCGIRMDWSAYADELSEVRKAIRDGRRICVSCQAANNSITGGR